MSDYRNSVLPTLKAGERFPPKEYVSPFAEHVLGDEATSINDALREIREANTAPYEVNKTSSNTGVNPPEETGVNPKDLIGVKKPSFYNVPPIAILKLMEVMADGARKYGRMNWRYNKVRYTIYLDAIFRHLVDVMDGEDVTRDTQVDQLAAIMASCAILIDAIATGNIVDDRSKTGLVANEIERQTHEK